MKKLDKHSNETKNNDVEIIYDIFGHVLDYLVAKVYYDKILNSINRNNINFLKKDTLLLKLHDYLESRSHFKGISYHSNIKILIGKNSASENSYDFDSFFCVLSDFDDIFIQDKAKLANFVSIIKESIDDNLLNICTDMYRKYNEPSMQAHSSLEDLLENVQQCLEFFLMLEKSDECKISSIGSEFMTLMLDSLYRTFLTHLDKASRLLYSAFLVYGYFFILFSIEENIQKQNGTSKKSHKEISKGIKSKLFSNCKKMSVFSTFVRKNIIITTSLKENHEKTLVLFDKIRKKRNQFMHNPHPYPNLNESDKESSHLIVELINNFFKEVRKISENIIQLLGLLDEFTDIEKFKKNNFFEALIKKLHELDISNDSLDILMSIYKDMESKKTDLNSFWEINL